MLFPKHFSFWFYVQATDDIGKNPPKYFMEQTIDNNILLQKETNHEITTHRE